MQTENRHSSEKKSGKNNLNSKKIPGNKINKKSGRGKPSPAAARRCVLPLLRGLCPRNAPVFFILKIALIFFLVSCKTSDVSKNEINVQNKDSNLETPQIPSEKKSRINLIFGGDIMAHTNNYRISDFSKIWLSVKDEISNSDFAFANIEAPFDHTKEVSSYPRFNMPLNYVKEAINSGFNVFSLSNNHTNDQGKTGIQNTQKNANSLESESLLTQRKIYFSGIKENDEFSYRIIQNENWKILFIAITELLNSPQSSSLINYVPPLKNERDSFVELITQLQQKYEHDLFILSVHTSEAEYKREVTKTQDEWYSRLLQNGVDIIWANHAHTIKERKIIISDDGPKIIMYGNGNTISGQRPNPLLYEENVDTQRDNTGDGLLYRVILEKEENQNILESENSNSKNKITIKQIKPIFITTYINTAGESVIKKLDDEFIKYLDEVPRKEWARYIEKRKEISEKTKDYIQWQ